MNNLTPEQTFVVMLATSGVVQGIKIVYIGLLKQPKPSVGVQRVLAFLVSVGLAYFWRSPVALPDPGVDPVAFGLALLTAASAVLGGAHLIYDVALDDILSGLGQALFRRNVLSP